LRTQRRALERAQPSPAHRRAGQPARKTQRSRPTRRLGNRAARARACFRACVDACARFTAGRFPARRSALSIGLTLMQVRNNPQRLKSVAYMPSSSYALHSVTKGNRGVFTTPPVQT
jgi:hypothetical protein